MKKVFTLVLMMALAVTGFAQIKSMSKKSVKPQPAQMIKVTGREAETRDFIPASNRNMMESPEETELSFASYDWQSNMGARNFTAVWPDGYAVMCYTQATEQAFGDRGTGLAIWDPAVGEWEYTEGRVEGIKTGFGSIARYKENGLVIAAHTATDLRIFIVEDFRSGNRDFGTGIVFPAPGGADPCWPVVQCSGENLDIIHVLCTNNGATTPYTDPLVYYRYENGDWTHQCEILPNVDENNASDGGSNISYFMPYDPTMPNRVSFILNNAWSDCKLVISENNGDDWSERVFWKHPGINLTYEDWFFYPRWTGAAFDGNDNLHVVYEYNGTTGEPGSGSYYPAIGGVGYWSEILPKNAMCLGGIGNVGEPFIMDTTYLMQDIYESEWYWSDANHEPLPEYIGELEIVDDNGNVMPRDATEGYWPDNSLWGNHGSYNCGKAGFASMFYDKANDNIYAFWSQIAGDSETMYYSTEGEGTHYLRIFCNMSLDGGTTWEGETHLITDFMNSFDEMVYGQVIPYLYTDENGAYLWYCYQNDQETGTFVQADENVWDNNFYRAVKVYVDTLGDAVEENKVEANTTLNVYPNPAQGSFTMQLSNESDVNIYNAVGQLVKNYKGVKELNVNLEAGIYFVQAGNQTQKVVVF